VRRYDINNKQRHVLLWIASRTGLTPIIPFQGSFELALVREKQIIENIRKDLKSSGVASEYLSAANERRGHVPWSAKLYFGKNKSPTKSDREYLSANLKVLEERKLVRRIDRTVQPKAKHFTTHVMLTRLGQAWCEKYWFDHIADIFEKNPKPVKNPMSLMARTGLDWDSVNSEEQK